MLIRINRNILECKDVIMKSKNCLDTCINRNILECKGLQIRPLQSTMRVLIETYWNVKKSIYTKSMNRPLVLIETYWNVKTHFQSALPRTLRINRNILECKADRWSFRHADRAYVLIETYWNVKTFGTTQKTILEKGINRNILECKAGNLHHGYRFDSVLIETYWNVKVYETCKSFITA